MYDNIDYSVEVNSIKRLAPSASRYNFRSGGSRVNTAALRKLSQYRKLRWQEWKLKEDICEMSSQLAAVGEHCGRVAHRGKKLTDLWLDLLSRSMEICWILRSLRQKCQNAIVAWWKAAFLTAQRSTHLSGEAPPQSSAFPLEEKNCAGEWQSALMKYAINKTPYTR